MRILQAIKFHYNKNLINYGILSGIISAVGAFFSPEVVRAIYKAVNSLGWTIGLGFVYALILIIVATPMVNALMWIFSRGERK